jgi:tetratricopeptide (TPR) repeat protein
MDFGLDFIADFLPAPPKKLASKKQKDEKKDEPERSLSSYLPTEVNGEVARTAEQYYKQGFREYRLGNYVRARESFELALQVNPAHERARFYLANAIKENDSEIKRLIAQARRAKDIGRLKEAQGYFETAMRHMTQDANNPDYVECEEALKNIKAGGVL